MEFNKNLKFDHILSMFLWLISFFIITYFIIKFHFKVDGDSKFYVVQLENMLNRPPSQWLVQKWHDTIDAGMFGFSGLFKDHMIGLVSSQKTS